jgi:hypothetical protein
MVEEVTRGWRTFHNEELRNFCHSLRTAMVKMKKKYTRYIKRTWGRRKTITVENP